MSASTIDSTTGEGWPRRRLLPISAAFASLALAMAGSTQARADGGPGPQNPPLPVPCTIQLNQENWAAGAGYAGAASPGCVIDGYFVVHLSGAAKKTAATGGDPSLVGQLSPNAHPNREVYTIAATGSGTYADVAIQSNGQIRLIPARSPAATDWSFFSLEGMHYPVTTYMTVMGNAVPLCTGAASAGCKGSLNTRSYAPGGGCAASTPPSLWCASAPAYYLDKADGIVHLVGGVTHISPAGDSLIGTLPPEASPNHSLQMVVHTWLGTYAVVSIDTTGEILVGPPTSPAVGDFAFISLEGISYPLEASPYPSIAVNMATYTPAPSGYATPAILWGLGGFPYLQGAVSYVPLSTGDISLVGTLPGGQAPHRTVYTIATTGTDGYMDVKIDPSGQIRLLAPPLPLVTDYSFVSLEGISWAA